MDKAVREDIIKWISKSENEELLETIKLIKETHSGIDWFDNLKHHEKRSLEKGQKDHRKGNALTSEEFWERHA